MLLPGKWLPLPVGRVRIRKLENIRDCDVKNIGGKMLSPCNVLLVGHQEPCIIG
jgi:hypothetical protein